MIEFTSGVAVAGDRMSCSPRRQALRAASLSIFAALATIAGCTLAPDADHAGEDAPRALPLPRTVRTAWVLSSGGPRGFVHVGVLRALDELGLVPDLIVGASVGALVGGLRATGRSVADIEHLAEDRFFKRPYPFPMAPRTGHPTRLSRSLGAGLEATGRLRSVEL